MLESKVKSYTKKRITERFPDLDLDFIDTKPYNRSMPDVFVIGPGVWAALEFKQSENSQHRPNQDFHIWRLSKKGYATFVFPENVEEVLDELEILFSS